MSFEKKNENQGNIGVKLADLSLFQGKQYMFFWNPLIWCISLWARTDLYEHTKLTLNTILSYSVEILINIYGTIEEFIQSYW